jgi:antitoxin (DNA-binding transcriptional repressor) of toxin-antitoxin stability system
METVTIRELRQQWPKIEKRLTALGELTVTRDGVPVATLAPPRPAAAKKARSPKPFHAETHLKRLKKIWCDKPPRFSLSEALERDRADRNFGPQ